MDVVEKLCNLDELRDCLVEHMIEKELSPVALGRIVGLNIRTLNKFLTTKKQMNFKTIAKLINYLDAARKDLSINRIDTDVTA